MKILIDIGHPAHVHLFKNFSRLMKSKGHVVSFTCRDKEFVKQLLDHEKFSYRCFGKHYKTIAGKIWGLARYVMMEFAEIIRFNADIIVSHGSAYAAIASWISCRPHISLEDTGNDEQVRIYKPFTKLILSPLVFYKDYGSKHFKYNAVHEWAYLNPEYFKSDTGLKNELGIEEKEQVVLLRFVSWNATHDKNYLGFSADQQKLLVQRLENKVRLFVSCEGEIPEELKKYALNLPPYRIHDFLSMIDLYIGEGASMASECAVLGTPSIYVNPQQAGTIDEQEKAGLLYHLKNGNGVNELACSILEKDKSMFIAMRDKYTASMTDLNKMLCRIVENWPKSMDTIKASGKKVIDE